MKVETDKSESFMNTIKLLKEFGIEHTLRFEKDKLVCTAEDNVASMMGITINKKLFSVYPEIENDDYYEICIKIEELVNSLKGIKEGTVLKLDFGEKLDKIGVKYTQKKKCEYELRVLDPPEESRHDVMMKGINSIKVKNSMVVELNEFLDALDKLIFDGGRSDIPKVLFNMTAKGCFVQDKQIEKGRSKIELIPLNNKVKLGDEKVALTMNKNFINNFLNNLKPITDKVLIELATDYPIKFTALASFIKIEYIIAPIVENT